MKRNFSRLTLLLMLALFIFIPACSVATKGKAGMDKAEKDFPQISINTIQMAVTGLMMEAGVSELDSSYDEVDTKEEVQNVTAGNGAYDLSDNLSASYPLNPAFDISKNGKVTVD